MKSLRKKNSVLDIIKYGDGVSSIKDMARDLQTP